MYNAMPLPLQLSKPAPMAADLATLVRAEYAQTTYDPNTQMAGGWGGYRTSSNSSQFGLINVDDVLNDITVLL